VGKNQFNEDRVRKHLRMLRQARKDFPEPNQSEVSLPSSRPLPVSMFSLLTYLCYFISFFLFDFRNDKKWNRRLSPQK
jgi:hypothetical protein